MLLLACVFAYISFLASRRLPDVLGEEVEIESLDINLTGNKVVFDKPKLRFDNTIANVSIQSLASQIIIDGFSFWDLLMNNEIWVDKLTIDSVSILIELPEDTVHQGSRKQIHLFITEIFTSIRVKQLELKDVNARIIRKVSEDTLISVNGFHLTANEVLVDTATLDNIFPLESRDSHVQIDSFKIRMDQAYVLSGSDLSIEDTTLNVSDLMLRSVYSKSEFASVHPYEKTRIDLKVAQLTSRKLRWDFDSSGFKIHSSNTLLDQAKLLVYKDKRPPDPPRKVKPLLSQLIQKLPFTMTINTVEISNSYIEYEQFPIAFPRTGKVFFDNLYISAYNLTNDSLRLRDESQMNINVQSDFMAKGKLKTNIYLDLPSPQQEFHVNGTLGELPVTYVNQVMTPLAGVTAEGQVHGLYFEFSGNEYDASGKTQFEYSDLKITIHDESRDDAPIKSLFGNLILRNNNRKEDSLTYKEGEIYFIRYQNKDFFNYMWNSLRVGLMDVVIPFYTNPDIQNPPTGPKYKEDF